MQNTSKARNFGLEMSKTELKFRIESSHEDIANSLERYLQMNCKYFESYL